MANEASQPLLFDGCHISLVPSKELTGDQIREQQLTLEGNGATVVELKADGKINISEVTHIISATSDFPQYTTACDHMIPVVTPNWIAASLLKNKLVQIRPYTPDPRLFFSGLTITCADIPDGDKDAIIGAVMAMGGQESSSLTKQTTHIVALTEEHPKCKQAKNKHLKCKIVLPHWFDDCLKLGRRIDEKPYLLPDPEILRMTGTEPVAVPSTPEMVGATAPRPDYLPHPVDSPDSRKLHVFHDKRVMLAADLNLNSRLRGILEDLIVRGGGSMTTTIDRANIYVCHYREGKDYITASRAGKDVGNLSWLFYLITYNEWTSPFRRLLHYPIPREPLEGFKGTKITLSNYGGEARIYLENLVVCAGGEYTKSMKQDNTHLITARKASEKCDAAQDWGIAMVNHLWIEESYAKCKAQSLTNPRYTHFPSRTNLGEVIGQTQFDQTILERNYFPFDVASPESARQQRSAMKNKDRNATVSRAPEPEDASATEVDMPDAEPELPPAITKTKKATTPAPVRTAHALSTPFTSRLMGTGKENETPSSASSRGAKDRALSRLQEQAPDIALYEKEKKRSGNGIWGGKRAADQIDKERGTRRASSVLEEEADAESEEEGRASKKPRTSKPPPQMRLMVTGYTKWVNAPKEEESDRKKLRDLGILIVQDPSTCNYLAAPTMVRTQKFLCALANGVTILNSKFIDTCLSSSSIPSTNSFILQDKANEKRFNIKLADVVKRAKANSRSLLRGIAVYCTEGIPNGPETYKNIVEANGGEFSVYRGRAGALRRREEGEEEAVYLLTGTTPKDKALWPKFTQMARDNGHVPRIVLTEWLLDTAMSQEIKWKDAYLAK